MNIVYAFLMLFGYFIFLGLFILAAKWIFCAISILMGDKESLHNYGNLCDPTIPVNEQYYDHRGYYDWRNRGEGNMSGEGFE